jgi:hypothetical protein
VNFIAKWAFAKARGKFFYFSPCRTLASPNVIKSALKKRERELLVYTEQSEETTGE